MRLILPDPAAALLGLRAMKTVASAAGRVMPAQRALMEAARRVILRLDVDIDALPPIDPETLAAGFAGAELRQQLINGMLVVALADGPPSGATVARIESFADALGVSTLHVTDLRRLAENHMTLFKLDFLRRSQVADIMKNQLEQTGPLGLAKAVLGMRGVIEDTALATRYRAWANLPEGTLGRVAWDFYQKNGFGMPGERRGFPEAGLYHDLSHVLGGYDTDPEGEVQVAAFTAGYKRERPLYLILFAVLTFSAGINMRPTHGNTTIGVLGNPGMAERMFAAIERGSHVNVDLSDKWDYWPYVGLPIDEVRHRLNILPRS